MTTPIILVLAILGSSTLLFIFEVFTVDKTAFLILVSTMLLGLVSPEEAVSGFANPAVIAIMALMILATSLEKSGVILLLANRLQGLVQWPFWISLPLFMVFAAGVSSFVSTTAVVIVFIKLINDLAERFQLDRAKYLLPISFAGILGGSCTLMGTSTNLLVNNILRQYQGEGMHFFEFSWLGISFFLLAMPLIVLLSRWVLPRSRFQKLSEVYDLRQYLTTLHIRENDPLAGKLIKDTLLYTTDNLRIVSLQRNGDIIHHPGKYIRLHPEDRLLLQATLKQVKAIYEQAGLTLSDSELNGEEKTLTEGHIHELLLLPNSSLRHLELKQIPAEMPDTVDFLALHKLEDPFKKSLLKIESQHLRLETGDRILIAGDQRYIQQFAQRIDAIVLRSIMAEADAPVFNRLVSIGALLLVIGLATTGIFSIMQSALLGVAICLLTGTLDLKDAYRGINWQVIFLLAGMIPLGIAMKNTGADAYLAEQLNHWLSDLSPAVIISGIFLFTMLMSGFVSNNATAIIIAPIALAMAARLGLSEKPFVYAVMFAANFSFFTPIGYQTNAIIYGMGLYKFRHFLIIGGVTSLLIWAAASLLLAGLL